MAESSGGQQLPSREFVGTILPKKDTTNKGMYKVNVPVLQPHMEDKEGIWCKNHIHNYRVTPSENGIVGTYYPLHPGMSVIVRFFSNHIESAYIDRIISDTYYDTLPFEIIERDDYYQIIRTPRYNNLIAIYEGPSPSSKDGKPTTWTPANSQSSKNIPRNSIHVYFNETRTTVVIDETGINVKTEDNIDITVDKNVKLTVKGTVDVKATGNINIQSDATMNLKASKIVLDGEVNINGNVKSKNLHEGSAVAATGGPASANDASSAANPILIEFNEYKYFEESSG